MLPLILLMGAGAAFLLTRKSDEPADATDVNIVPELPAQVSETPFALPPLPKAILTRLPPLDQGLSPEESVAIRNAVTHETLAANLNGFASTFEPMFPIAASVLRGRASDLQGGSITTGGVEPCCDDCADGKHPPCGGLPCDPVRTGAPIVAGLPRSLVG